jgi:hypothetical protein
MKKILVLSLAALMTLSEALPALSIALVTVAALTPSESQALPVDRMAGRQGARNSRQAGRQTSRARRRGCYGLPGGAVPFAYGGYRYYRVGPRYYYPYMYMGRTVYIDINVNGGYPAPPPPIGSIDIDIY